jgi:two-component system, LuxR family, sensor kinase FixL
MNLIVILWSMAAAVSLSLAAIHGMVWLSDRKVRAELWFAVAATCLSTYPFFDLAMMQADSAEQFGSAARLALVPVSMGIIAMLLLVHSYFGTGRRWLLVAALTGRGLALAVNLLLPHGLFFEKVTSIREITFLGEAVSAPVGEIGRWLWVEHLAAVIWTGYLLDASWRLWRTGGREGRRRVVMIGGGIVCFMITGLTQASLVVAQVIAFPVAVTLSFLILLTMMGYELSRDVLRAAHLANSLKESEQRLELAATAAQLAPWEWNMRTNVIWTTNDGRRLYGLPDDDVVDFSRFIGVVHPDDREGVESEVGKTLAGADTFSAEYRILLPDGTERWIGAAGRLKLDERRTPLLLRGVSMDITQRKRSEQQLAQQRQDLTHLSRVSMLGELAGTIAHELNQPLAAMLSNSQVGCSMVKSSQVDMDEMYSILEDIVADAKRAGGIIHGMRAMFKKEAALELQAVDLNDAVTLVCGLLHSEIVVKRARIDLHLEENLPLVMAGRVEIQQVLINLILNSLDAMRNAGCADATIQIRTEHRDGAVFVSVHDNGPGIPQEILARLFEAFVTSKPSGLGLGLAISHGIIKRFDGSLSGENDSAGGAVFRIRLPQAP